MLKSFTDNQNWRDILQKYYIKYTQHNEVKENGKDENYTTQKDTESSVSVTKHFLLQPWSFHNMGVKLNICLLLLLVAIISSQGFNLRKKEDSKDEKPFGNYRRGKS